MYDEAYRTILRYARSMAEKSGEPLGGSRSGLAHTVLVANIAVLALLTVLGRVPLWLGVLGHEGSTLLVVANGLRLLAHRGAPATDDRPKSHVRADPAFVGAPLHPEG